MTETEVSGGREGKEAIANRTAFLPERGEMMQTWADYLDRLKANADHVLPFRSVVYGSLAPADNLSPWQGSAPRRAILRGSPPFGKVELADLEVDEHVAEQQAVVEEKIDEEVILFEAEPLLPGFEEESLAGFEQEILNMRDDSRFQVGLRIAGLFSQAEKPEDVGFLEQVLRPGDMLALPREVVADLDSFMK